MPVGETCITLLHTNDIHSHLEAAAKVAHYVQKVREQVPDDRLLLVDCGDFLDKSRMETEGTAAGVNRDLLREMRYDALTLGNNEGLTLTYEQLHEYGQSLDIPIVCANFRPRRPGSKRPDWLVPSLIVRKANLRIGLIGLTAPFNDYYELLGWHAEDPLAAAARELSRLRGEVDIVVVMSHLGLRYDERLAAQVAGIDLILGAHTHHLLEKPLYVGRAAMSAAGKFGRHIGHLRLSLTPGSASEAQDKPRITVAGGCVPLDDGPSDPAVLRINAAAYAEARQRMSRTVAKLDKPLKWSAEAESPLANLLAEAVRIRTDAEIGLVNAGQLLNGLDSGIVTEEIIHAICPSPINCCSMELTGRQILQVTEQSLLPEFIDLEIRGFGFRGHKLGTLCYDGLSMTVDPESEPYRKVVEIRINGEPLDLERVYKVGTRDMFTFGVGYVELKEGRNIRYVLPEFIRHLLCEALADRSLVAASRQSRIAFVR